MTKADVLEAAVDAVLDMLDGYTAYDIGPMLTCDEAETFADLFRIRGRIAEAADFIDAHAREDDEGDQHYRGDDDDEG